MDRPTFLGVLNLGLAAVALSVLVAAVAIMATVPVGHWHTGTTEWTVQYEPCASELCPIQEGAVNLPVGTSVFLHWATVGSPDPVHFWIANADGRPVFYGNTSAATFGFTTVDSPYEVLLVVPQALNSTLTLELNYTYEQSALLI